jgi:hypothetical protein
MQKMQHIHNMAHIPFILWYASRPRRDEHALCRPRVAASPAAAGGGSAAHVRAASGASRLQQDEHALSVSYHSLLEAELAHSAATAGAIRAWPPPPPSSGAPVPHPTSTGEAASSPTPDRGLLRGSATVENRRPTTGSGPGPTGDERPLCRRPATTPGQVDGGARLQRKSITCCASRTALSGHLCPFPLHPQGNCSLAREVRELGHVCCASSLFLMTAASSRSLNCSFC